MIGTQVAHYLINEKLGEGGMGVVYKAQDTKLQRTVALKFLSKDITRDAEAKQRFIQEARAAAALNHQNICTVYEINEINNQSFIVMEYVDGISLKEKIESGPLAISEVEKIALQIATGLQEAHEKSIVHRDIKSANIMLTKKGQVKITDFGLAKLSEQSNITKTGTTLGTVAYMSPEQARGDEVNNQTDIWSFGVVLYEMITGGLPFKGYIEHAVIYSIINEEPKPISEIREEVPEIFEDILAKALEKNQAKRYLHAEDIIFDLHQESEGSSKKNFLSRNRSKKTVAKKNRLITASILVILLAILSVITYYSFFTKSKRSEISPTAIAVLPFSVSGGEAVAFLKNGIVDLLSSNLDGAGLLRSVDPRALLNYIAHSGVSEMSPDFGRDVAEHFGAGLFMLGSVFESGGQVRIIASLYGFDHSLKKEIRATAEGKENQAIQIIDDLTKKLIEEMNLSKGDRLTSIAATTTNSVPALKAYLEGLDDEISGNFLPAYEAYKNAIVEDSTFALAWYKMSFVAHIWLMQNDKACEAFNKAFKYKDRLSDHDNLKLYALQAELNGNVVKAQQLYHDLTYKYPDDINAWFNLNSCYLHWGSILGQDNALIESEKALKRCIFLEPANNSFYQQLLSNYMNQRNVEKSNILLKKMQELKVSHDYLWMVTAPWGFIIGDRMLQKKTVEEARLKRTVDIMGAIINTATQTNDPFDAIAFANLLTKPSQAPYHRGNGHTMKALIYMAKGQKNNALKEVALAKSFTPAIAHIYRALFFTLPYFPFSKDNIRAENKLLIDWDAANEPLIEDVRFPINAHKYTFEHLRLYLLGLLNVGLDEFSLARQYAANIVSLETPADEISIMENLAAGIRSKIEWQKQNIETALSILEQQKIKVRFPLMHGSPFYTIANERYLRAELLYTLEKYEEALAYFNTLTYSIFDILYLAPSHLKQGEIYEKLGQYEKAKKHYNRFIDLWQDCDPELRLMVEKAKQRLKQLNKDKY